LSNPERLRFEFDSALGAVMFVYQKRVEILAGLTENAMKLTDRQSSFGASALQNQIENKKRNPFAKLTAQPAGSFVIDQTPQLGRFEDEKVYFVKLLQVCKKNNIRLIVVNMPVTESYENLVPSELRSRWPSEIQEATKKYGFEVLDFNDKHVFTTEDFLDSAHLNGKGSLKLNDLVSKEIARRGLVRDL
jgi:RNase H-fold protein (predicted Holliday junction resolvase)